MNVQTLFNSADELYEKGDFISAFNLFAKASKKGDTSSMLRMASMYTCGEGVLCDYDKAAALELKAINAGDKMGLVNLGITYRMKGDIRQSKEWFLKAIDAGDGSGALELAKLYMVSDREAEITRRYLDIALSHNDLCESDIEEVKSILSDL